MVKDWMALADEWAKSLGQLRTGLPEVMTAFRSLDGAASKDGALDPKTKELIALGLAVGTRCDGCIAFHARAAIKHGATREEVMEAVGVSIVMGGGPSVMYAALAIEAYDQFAEKAKSKAA